MTGIFETWQIAGVLAVLVGFLIVSLALMASYIFNLPKLRGWARNEFYQSVANAILVGGLIILFSSINGMINGLVGSPCTGVVVPLPIPTTVSYSACAQAPTITCPVDCPASKAYFCNTGSPGYAASFDHAKCFISKGIWSLGGTYAGLVGSNLALGVPLSLQFMLAPFQQGFGIAPSQGLAPVNDFFGLVNIFLGTAIGLLFINSFLLDFIRFKLVAVLPIGIVMRAFPLTRGAGAALISLFAGMYVVYPLLFALDAEMYYRDSVDFRPGEVSIAASAGGIQDYLDSVAYSIFIVGFFFPVFNLTITFAFMKEFAKLLGGEIDVSALMKLV